MGPTTGQGLLYEPILHKALGIMPIDYNVTYNIGRIYSPGRAVVM